jgi:23S rRNA-/tRNA-specific pseudouridylate synthase
MSGELGSPNEKIATPPHSNRDIHHCVARMDGIEMIYNDSSFTIFCKPQGLATMGDSPSLHRSDSLLLPPDEVSTSKYKKCVPTHRLDKSTGGLVLCSKSLPCEIFLKELFRKKEIQKRYRAIVLGYVEAPAGTISSIIQGTEAVSEYRVTLRTRSGSYGWISTVDLWPITGKKHQLRRHMKILGHPIIGDKRYWDHRDKSKPLIQDIDVPVSLRQCYLWALEISFLHPNGSGESVTVSIDEPPLYSQLREIEEKTYHEKESFVHSFLSCDCRLTSRGSETCSCSSKERGGE